MDIFLTVSAILCCLIGLLGCLLPVLPGPPANLLGIFLIHWTGYAQYSPEFLILWSALTLVVTLLDYYLPVWMTQRFGGSRKATIGATVGLILGMFFFPTWGIIIGPFLGAFLGEISQNNNDNKKAFKVAMGSFAAFLAGTGLKLICSGMMTYYVIRTIIA